MVFASVRALMLLLGWAASQLPAGRPDRAPNWTATPSSEGWHAAFTGWERFDAAWYLGIAANGYSVDDGSAAFFPLYPLLIRAFGSVVGGRWLLAAFLVSNLALLIALAVLYRLTAMEFSEDTARRVILLLCLSPTGFALFAPYTESLFLALTVGCFYALRRDAWAAAALCAAAASATRSSGLLLTLPIAIHLLSDVKTRLDGSHWKRLQQGLAVLAASASAVVGCGLYFLYWAWRADWSVPLDAQSTNFGREASLPWEVLATAARQVVQADAAGSLTLRRLYLALVLVALLAGVWLVRRARAPYVSYYWASLVLPLLLTRPDDPLASLPRYYMVLFPMYWALTHFAERNRGSYGALLVTSGLLAVLLSVLFVAWQPVF